jgi:Rad52/22 family double-strand break repair protein
MALTDTQTKYLKAKLKRRHVKTREAGGSSVSYVEGWHAIAEANRIFGFDSWDRQTLAPRCHWAHLQYRETVCFYSTKVRITVRAGDTVTVREGIGTGFGRAPQPEFAHDIALKAAETDATKRALATFGNPFGLALYDRGQAQVTKAREKVTTDKKRNLIQSPDLVLSESDGKDVRFSDHEAFLNAALRQIESLESTDSLYAFWSRNSAAFGKLRIDTEPGDNLAKKLIDALKERARQVGQHTSNGTTGVSAPASDEPISSYLIPKEKRLRDRAHLAFVASEPCLVCGRRPAQAHHLRFAQSRAMGLKVSDEFTVPLCNTHHDELHRVGDERAWWARNGILEPLKYAARLWAASRDQRKATNPTGNETLDPDLESEFNEPYLRKGSGAAVRST